MSQRFFSFTARALVKFLGFDKEKLPPTYKTAVEAFTKPGGSAEEVQYLPHGALVAFELLD